MAKQYYCFLERFNNYFNRKLIRKETLEDYQDASEDFFIPVEANGNMTPFDFNPNDNITTEIIANNVPFDPDYFLLLDADEKIVSRWFVLEQKRNRQGQWLYFLRRDVLADSYNELSDAPLYVEKGIIKNLENPLLLNNEDLRVNQIKKEEILLKDKTECAWLVMYLKKGVLGSNTVGSSGKITIDVPKETDFIYETLSTPITSWSFYQYINNDYKVDNFNVFRVNITLGTPSWAHQNRTFQFWDDAPNADLGNASNTGTNLSNTEYFAPMRDRLASAYVPQRNALRTLMLSAFGYKDLSTLLQYNDKIIKDSQGKYFKVHVFSTNSGTTTHKITSADAPTLKNAMGNIWNTAYSDTVVPNDSAFNVKANWQNWRISLEELTDINTEVDFSVYQGDGTTDSMLFDAICLPYGKLEMFIAYEVSVDVFTDRDRSLKIMNSLATQLTSQYVLDLQLLPYCPCQNLINEDYFDEGGIVVPEDDADNLTLTGVQGGDVTDVILVCPTSNFTFDIEQKIEISDASDVPDTYKRKFLNDCSMVRLCSPNYNGLFDMNLAKNGGLIKTFNVDVTLRPFNPYIHVNPDFSFLYGQDFNDVRGLICGGDFSLGIINDAWNVYEIQNKNYQAIFDRQIQNLDVNNAITREESLWGAVAGTVQGTASGAIAGGMVGGGYGAIAGAVIGGGASAVGGAMDIANLEKRQQEARNYAIDNFNLQLGNVRALPNSITKTSALTYNNKLFPFIEIYQCSEEEKEAYYLKLKYNGMTVSKIDVIQNFKSDDDSNSNYFRARLIRITNISEDNHYVETINEELMKGVFI